MAMKENTTGREDNLVNQEADVSDYMKLIKNLTEGQKKILLGILIGMKIQDEEFG